MKPNTIVKYNYEDIPEEWKGKSFNPFSGVHFLFLGEITNMKGHAPCISLTDNKVYIFDIDNIKKVTEEELQSL